VKTLARQFFQYGLWKIRVLQKHPRQMSARQFVPPLFVLALLCTGIAAAWEPLLAWAFLVIAGAYAVALVAATCAVARQHGWRDAGRILMAFATMHVSWGAGFLWGVLRFARRWFADEPQPPRLGAGSIAPPELVRITAVD
jgi:succinoglycan biosynthesis protein ExoA